VQAPRPTCILLLLTTEHGLRARYTGGMGRKNIDNTNAKKRADFGFNIAEGEGVLRLLQLGRDRGECIAVLPRDDAAGRLRFEELKQCDEALACIR
jgi:hypothetical protein